MFSALWRGLTEDGSCTSSVVEKPVTSNITEQDLFQIIKGILGKLCNMMLNYVNKQTLLPLPQGEIWKTVCNAPGLVDIPSPLQAAANPHGLQDTYTVSAEVQTDTVQKALESTYRRCLSGDI